jgi:hypothetical protein
MNKFYDNLKNDDIRINDLNKDINETFIYLIYFY